MELRHQSQHSVQDCSYYKNRLINVKTEPMPEAHGWSLVVDFPKSIHWRDRSKVYHWLKDYEAQIKSYKPEMTVVIHCGELGFVLEAVGEDQSLAQLAQSRLDHIFSRIGSYGEKTVTK